MAFNPSALHRYADYQRYNFNREPNWRWERINYLNESVSPNGNSLRCSTRDDDYVREGRAIIKAHQRFAGIDDYDPEHEKLIWKNPHLHYAYEIFRGVYGGPPETSLYLQARLLAGQSNDDIAKIMGSTPQTVEWYEALFFDVRQFRECRDWITLKILLPALRRVPPPEDANTAILHQFDTDVRDDVVEKPWLDGSLKVFAYFGGPVVADIMLSLLQANQPLRSSEEFFTWIDGNWKQLIRRRSAVSALQFRVNKYNVMQLFDTHARIMELEVSDESSEEQRSNSEKIIKAMLDELPCFIGNEGKKKFKGTKVGKFDESAAELRDAELLAVTADDADGPVDVPTQLPAPRRNKLVALEKTEDL